MTTIWQELGIDPTQDPKTVKQAYAVRLKATRPEDDPDGFQRLRAAYTAALRTIAAQTPIEPSIETLPPLLPPEPAGTASPAPLHAEPPFEKRRTMDTLNAALSGGNAETAVSAMQEALAGHLLSIDTETLFAARLIDSLLNDPSIPAKRLFEIAQQFGWYGVADRLRGPNSRLEQRLCARIDAGLWLAALKREAASRRYWIGGGSPGAARLLLGSEPALLVWMSLPTPLPQRLAEAMLHAPQLGDAIDVDRIEALRKILAQRKKYRSLPLVINMAVMFALLVLGSFAGVRALTGVVGAIVVEVRFGVSFGREYRPTFIFPAIALLWILFCLTRLG